MLADCSWQLEKLERFLKGDALDELARSEARVLLAVSVALLYIWTILSEACYKRLAVLRIDAQVAAYMAVLPVAESLLYLGVERTVESADHIVPYELSFSYLVEILLYICSESIVEDCLEILYKIISYDHSDVLRKKASLLSSYSFVLCGSLDDSLLEREVCDRMFLSGLVALDDVSASLSKGGNRRGVC